MPSARLIDAISAEELWQHPLANELMEALAAAFGGMDTEEIRRLAASAGLPLGEIRQRLAPRDLWEALAEIAAPAGKWPKLLQTSWDDQRVTAHRERIRGLAEFDRGKAFANYQRCSRAGPIQQAAQLWVPLDGTTIQRQAKSEGYWDDYPEFSSLADWPQLEGDYHPARQGEPDARMLETGGERVPDVADRLLASERVVLLGEPGCGKTCTLLRLLGLYLDAWDQTEMVEPENLLIPILVPLRQFSGLRAGPEGAAVRERFGDFLRRQFHDLAPIADRLLRDDRVVLLLDAFNEMPRYPADDHERNLVDELLDELRSVKRFVISCRFKDYRDELGGLERLEQIYLQPLDPEKIEAVISTHLRSGQRSNELWRKIGGSNALKSAWAKVTGSDGEQGFWRSDWNPPRPWSGAERAFDRDELRAWNAIHQGARLMALCRNPFRLRWLCRIYAETNELPSNRADLFDRMIRHLLAEEAKRDEALGRPWAAGFETRVLSMLQSAALVLQSRKRTVLPLKDLLAETEASGSESLLKAAIDANILAAISGDIAADSTEVSFQHQLFQEYFAARAITRMVEAGTPPTEHFAQGEGWWDPNVWRETYAILGEHIDGGPERVARWLVPFSPEVALELLAPEAAGPVDLEAIASDLRERLVDSAESKSKDVHPYGRAAAYRVLGRLDADPRRGVGVFHDEQSGLDLPDIEWLPVPDEGPFIYQDGERLELPDFRIARYPITWIQFQAFVDDPEGYDSAAWRVGLAGSFDGPGDAAWPIANHPRERVDWYEAVAFCRWLTARFQAVGSIGPGEEVHLPTEQQWEKAARGLDGRVYPWKSTEQHEPESEYEAGRANIDETDRFDWMKGKGRVGPYFLGRTSAVGIYDNASPYGVLDMTGNVWDWCLNEYDEPANVATTGSRRRVVRGGSWYNDLGGARAAFRSWVIPGSRYSSDGFRVVVSSPISL